MADRLRRLLEENPGEPSTGREQVVVLGSVTPQGYFVEPLSIESVVGGGPLKIASPPIARSATEFEKVARDRGLIAAAAVA